MSDRWTTPAPIPQSLQPPRKRTDGHSLTSCQREIALTPRDPWIADFKAVREPARSTPIRRTRPVKPKTAEQLERERRAIWDLYYVRAAPSKPPIDQRRCCPLRHVRHVDCEEAISAHASRADERHRPFLRDAVSAFEIALTFPRTAATNDAVVHANAALARALNPRDDSRSDLVAADAMNRAADTVILAAADADPWGTLVRVIAGAFGVTGNSTEEQADDAAIVSKRCPEVDQLASRVDATLRANGAAGTSNVRDTEWRATVAPVEDTFFATDSGKAYAKFLKNEADDERRWRDLLAGRRRDVAEDAGDSVIKHGVDRTWTGWLVEWSPDATDRWLLATPAARRAMMLDACRHEFSASAGREWRDEWALLGLDEVRPPLEDRFSWAATEAINVVAACGGADRTAEEWADDVAGVTAILRGPARRGRRRAERAALALEWDEDPPFWPQGPQGELRRFSLTEMALISLLSGHWPDRVSVECEPDEIFLAERESLRKAVARVEQDEAFRPAGPSWDVVTIGRSGIPTWFTPSRTEPRPTE